MVSRGRVRARSEARRGETRGEAAGEIGVDRNEREHSGIGHLLGLLCVGRLRELELSTDPADFIRR